MYVTRSVANGIGLVLPSILDPKYRDEVDKAEYALTPRSKPFTPKESSRNIKDFDSTIVLDTPHMREGPSGFEEYNPNVSEQDLTVPVIQSKIETNEQVVIDTTKSSHKRKLTIDPKQLLSEDVDELLLKIQECKKQKILNENQKIHSEKKSILDEMISKLTNMEQKYTKLLTMKGLIQEGDISSQLFTALESEQNQVTTDITNIKERISIIQDEVSTLATSIVNLTTNNIPSGTHLSDKTKLTLYTNQFFHEQIDEMISIVHEYKRKKLLNDKEKINDMRRKLAILETTYNHEKTCNPMKWYD